MPMGRWIPLILRCLLVTTAQTSPPPDFGAFGVSGSRGIVLTAVTVIPTPSEVAGRAMRYLVCIVTFTNTTNADLAPQVERFAYVDARQRRFFAAGAGEAPIADLSNSAALVARGASQTYTLAFRVPVGDVGILVYDPT